VIEKPESYLRVDTRSEDWHLLAVFFHQENNRMKGARRTIVRLNPSATISTAAFTFRPYKHDDVPTRSRDVSRARHQSQLDGTLRDDAEIDREPGSAVSD
jgi:hypothetical protein